MSALEEVKKSLVQNEDDSPFSPYAGSHGNYEDFTEDKFTIEREPKQSFIGRLNTHSMIAQKELALIHRKASQAGKNIDKGSNSEKCQCCGYYIDKPIYKISKGYNHYKDLGIVYVLFFEYVALIVLFLLLLFFIVCLPCSIGYLTNIGFYDRNDYISSDNHIAEPKVYRWQIILQCVGLAMIMVFYPILQFVLQKRLFKYTDDTLTESSFTIFVKNLPSDFTNLELREHFDKFLPSEPGNYKTLIVINCFELSDAIKVARRINEVQAKIAFLNAYKDEYNENAKHGFICKREISIQGLENELKVLEQIKREKIRGHKKLDSIRSFFSKLCKKRMDYEVQEDEQKKPEYSAFVVLRKMSHAFMLKKELNFSIFNYLTTLLLPSFLQKSTAYRFKGNYIYTEMTPELSDIIWENVGFAKWKKILREIGIVFITFIVVYILLTYAFAPLAIESFVNKENNNESLKSSISISAVSAFMNFIGKNALVKLSIKEKHYSHTDLYLSLYKKFVGFMVTTVLGLQYLILVIFVDTGITVNYIDYVLSSLLINGIVSPILAFCFPIALDYVKFYYYYKIKKSLDMTQKEANKKFELPEIMICNDLANLMLVLFIGITYLPVLPEGVVIVIASCLIQACLFHIKLAKFSRVPRKLDVALILLASESLPWVILLYSYSIMIFYSKNIKDLVVVEIFIYISWAYLACLAFGLFRFLKMSSFSDKRIKNSIIDNKMFFDYYEKFTSDYESENPATCLNGFERLEAYKRNPSEKNFVDVEYKEDLFQSIKFSFANYFI